VFLYDLDANEPAVSELRCGMLDGGTDLLSSMRRRTKGVSQGYVFSMGKQPLHGLGVAFHELVEPQLVSLDKFVYVVCGGHLGITSTVGG
jgi:hypothetical protein